VGSVLDDLSVLGVNGTGLDVLMEDNTFTVGGGAGIELGEDCSRLQVKHVPADRLRVKQARMGSRC
jgi:hypothetical protein